MNMIALAIMGLLIIALLVLASGLVARPEQRSAEAGIIPSSVLMPATQPPPTTDSHASITQQPSPEPSPSAADQPGMATAAQVTTAAATTPAAGLPAPASLPLGTIVDVDGWSATLLRPDYALILDGAIGDLKPSGRFVLALMAISNNSADLRRIPADLLTLVDSRGRRYSPAPNASSAYLSLYGRGQHGDLALEDAITPRSGMRSVPILFDVPDDATGMVLTVRDGGTSGWPIEGAAAPATNVGP
ncbi:DUF4352 domain-containing protein [Oscillochloris sp. ZM17-4]|uniref:DUF4352 domain-containing protein n=1 Tax=Oscillochloris sp. ZM17-4 TaxID=2866714 RepID=UPI001C7360E3|nr:DUF4352 domain-containing protein [Oscillochloris sp. ZM17-4]MBX0331066.1 DUF4352 domain-containing protein [Oscillochloris sp. ZM17-4]